MIPQVKGIRLACPECKIHFETDSEPVDNVELVCSKCERRYPIWEGRPCFLPQSNLGLDPVWRNAFDKEKSRPALQKLLVKLGQILRAPRITLRKKPHFEILANYVKLGEFKALYVGYNQFFPDHIGYNLIQMDVVPKRCVDIVAIGESLPFENNSFEFVAISGVIEHTQQPFRVIAEAHRVLKNGGTLYVSSPWLYPFHGSDHYRFSNEGLRLLCSAFDEVEVGSLNGPLHAFGIFVMQAVVEYFSFGNKYVRYGLSIPVSWLVLPFMFLDALVNKDRKKRFVLDANIYAVATKKKNQAAASNSVSG